MTNFQIPMTETAPATLRLIAENAVFLCGHWFIGIWLRRELSRAVIPAIIREHVRE
jgi:hypothetical protein